MFDEQYYLNLIKEANNEEQDAKSEVAVKAAEETAKSDISVRKPAIKKPKETDINYPYFTSESSGCDFVITKHNKTTEIKLCFIVSNKSVIIRDKTGDYIADEKSISSFFHGYSEEKISTNGCTWLRDYYRDPGHTRAILRLMKEDNFIDACKKGIGAMYGGRYDYSKSWDKWSERNFIDMSIILLKPEIYQKYMPALIKISKVFPDSMFDKRLNILLLCWEIWGDLNILSAWAMELKKSKIEIAIKLMQQYEICRGKYIVSVYDNTRRMLKKSDPVRLASYLFHDFYEQGYDVIDDKLLELLADYMDMQISICGKVKEKYPKYLEEEHDLVTRYFEAHKNEIDNAKIKAIADREVKAGHTSGNYNGFIFKIPESVDDLVFEGNSLGHCVGGYGNIIATEQSVVYFMRREDEPDKSYMTIEVRHDGTLGYTEAYGKRLTLYPYEKEAILSWAVTNEKVENLTSNSCFDDNDQRKLMSLRSKAA